MHTTADLYTHQGALSVSLRSVGLPSEVGGVCLSVESRAQSSCEIFCFLCYQLLGSAQPAHALLCTLLTPTHYPLGEKTTLKGMKQPQQEFIQIPISHPAPSRTHTPAAAEAASQGGWSDANRHRGRFEGM